MVALKTLETLGYDRAFFKLKASGTDDSEFTYYTFDKNIASKWITYWDIVGIHYRSKEPLLLDVQLMYIDEEALINWPPFKAPRDTPGLISFDPPELLALIEFFETLSVHRLSDGGQTLAYFCLLDIDDLVKFRFDSWPIDDKIGNYYRYLPDEGVQSLEEISIVGLPRWSAKSGVYQQTGLTFATFDRQRLDDPLFRPSDTDGLGTMRFNQPALEEFIALLKQRTYENFVRGMQA
jgi:hypothetical protein